MVIGLASGMTPLIDINYYLYLYLCKKNEPFFVLTLYFVLVVILKP